MKKKFALKTFLTIIPALFFVVSGTNVSAGKKNVPVSDPSAVTIFIDGCDSGVPDIDGTMNDQITSCGEEAANHGAFVSCVAHLTNTWKKDGFIDGQAKGAIQRCAASADIPPASDKKCKDDADCDDGLYCNGVETCQDGVCILGEPLIDGELCDDGNACTENDTCAKGVCTGVAMVCDDGNVCTENDACVEGTCQPGTNVADGTPCPDEEICNGEETCQAGACISGEPLSGGEFCDDSNVCTENGSCIGGTCASSPVADGTLCSDNETCNGEETCQAGICTLGTALNDGDSCDDGLYCTVTDTCQAGICTGSDSPCEEGAMCYEETDFCEPPLLQAIKHLFLLWKQGR
jgi:hypothetical protein